MSHILRKFLLLCDESRIQETKRDRLMAGIIQGIITGALLGAGVAVIVFGAQVVR